MSILGILTNQKTRIRIRPYTAVIVHSKYGYGPYKYGRILKQKMRVRIRYGAVPYRTVFRIYGTVAEPYSQYRSQRV